MLKSHDNLLCHMSDGQLLGYYHDWKRNESFLDDVDDTNMSYDINDTVLLENLQQWRRSCNVTTPLSAEDDGGSYGSAVPVVIITFCALTFIFNVFIVVAAYWMRRPVTPTMYFSLSLAAADAISSLTLGLGLVLNRYSIQ